MAWLIERGESRLTFLNIQGMTFSPHGLQCSNHWVDAVQRLSFQLICKLRCSRHGRIIRAIPRLPGVSRASILVLSVSPAPSTPSGTSPPRPCIHDPGLTRHYPDANKAALAPAGSVISIEECLYMQAGGYFPAAEDNERVCLSLSSVHHSRDRRR